MIKTQRQNKLIKILRDKEFASVSELSEKLNFSLMTIRRDLEILEKKGIVKKVHGGAMLIKKDNPQPSFYERIDEFSEEKIKIGKEAAKFIADGSIVFFDAGTTPLAMVDNISDSIEFTAITSGLMTAIALCNKPNINVISIGGSIHNTSYSATNHIAVEQIKKFNGDIAFISTKGFSVSEGTYELLLPLIEIKKAIVSVSKKIILLADHSKFETKSLSLAVPIDNINTIITDNKTPKYLVDEMKAKGIEVIIA